MPDDIKPEGQQAEGGAPASSPSTDELKNLKAEMNRKLENINATIAEQLKSLKAAPSAPAPSAPAQKKVSVFDDEDAYAESVVSAAEERIARKLAAEREAQAKQQATIGALMSEFPELGNNDHELTKKAAEIFQALPDEDKASRLAMEAAVRKAALEVGVKPKSKRGGDENDAFSMGGSGSRSVKRDSESLDPRTVEFAKLMGVDPEAVKKRVKTRKNFTSWE